jgi:hypothetical protein
VARGHGGRPRSQHKTKAWSVLQLHGVSVWRGQGFGGLKAAIWSRFRKKR